MMSDPVIQGGRAILAPGITLLLAVTAVLLLSACAGPEREGPAPVPGAEPTPQAVDEPEDGPGAPDQQVGDAADSVPPVGEETVEIVDFAYRPEDLEVPASGTVEWVQSDPSRHTVDFEDGQESGPLEQGDRYSRTFDRPGEYHYVCFFHPRMTATVTVTD
ncbi:MAG: hypothetical protein GEU81_06500 [Nitriliruptorales bacterium]|nr:hypothetical protein [Nitriliruptorales bacterium]